MLHPVSKCCDSRTSMIAPRPTLDRPRSRGSERSGIGSDDVARLARIVRSGRVTRIGRVARVIALVLAVAAGRTQAEPADAAGSQGNVPVAVAGGGGGAAAAATAPPAAQGISPGATEASAGGSGGEASTATAPPVAPSNVPGTPAAPGGVNMEAMQEALKASLLVQHAMQLSRAGRYEDAEKELLEADRRMPGYCTVLMALSNAQLKLGKPDEALASLERAIRAGKGFDDRSYLLVARIYSGRRQFTEGQKQLIAWGGDRPVTANFHAAIGILRMGNYDLDIAELSLREALKLEPANEAALTAMAELYGGLSQYPKLQPYLDAGAAKNPKSTIVLMLTANNLLRQERYAEARTRYEQLLAIDPKNAEATVNLGACMHGLGDVPGAIAAFQRAIELDGQSVEAPVNLYRVLLKQGKTTEARDVLIAARRRGVEALEVLNSLVLAYRATNEYDKAFAVAAESLKKFSNQPPLRKLVHDMEDELRASGAKPAAATDPASTPPPAPTNP